MTAARFYSSTAGSMELQADITDSSTTIQVDSTVGLPGTTPFTLVIDPGSTEEIVDVTGVAGTSLTVTRGRDGSPAQAHVAGAIIRHMATARDFREAQEHIGNTAAHGTTGAVVGTTDTQALTNKDLSSGTNVFPTSLATDSELAAHTNASSAVHGVTGSVVGTGGLQALTNKDLSSLTNTFPTSLATDSELAAHSNATTGVHGVTGNVVGVDSTQSLTHKNLQDSTNTFPPTLVDTVTDGQALSRDLPLGDLTNATARRFRVKRKSTVSSQTLESTFYTASGVSTSAAAITLEVAGAEVARAELRNNGDFVITTGNVVASNIPNTGVAGTSSLKAGKKLHWGVASGTTNGSGILTVTHNCGFTPTVAVFTPDTVPYQVSTQSIGATTFTVLFASANGTALASTAVSGYFICGE